MNFFHGIKKQFVLNKMNCYLIYSLKTIYYLVIYNMGKNNLAGILRTFSKTELKEFRDFLNSPYFNKNKNTVKLFDYLKGRNIEFDPNPDAKKKIYKRIYNNKKYNDSTYRVLIHNLTALSKEFMSIKLFRSNKLQCNQNLNLALYSRKIYSLLGKNLNYLLKELNNTKDRDDEYYYFLYSTLHLKNNLQYTNRYHKNVNQPLDEGFLSQSMEALMQFFLVISLRYYRQLLFFRKGIKISLQYKFIEKVLEIVKELNITFPENLHYNLFLNEALLLSENKTEYYNKIKDILFKNKNEIKRGNKCDSVSILFSFISSNIFRGNYSYYKDAQEIYKFALDNNLLTRDEIDSNIEIFIYFFALRAAFYNKDFNYAEYIHKNTVNKLFPGYRKFAEMFAKSWIEFEKNNFSEAYRLLGKIKNPEHVHLKPYFKNHLLKCLIELGMYEAASFQIDSYRHILKKIRKYYAENSIIRHSNFLKCCTIFLKIKDRKKASLLTEFQYFLDTEMNVWDRPWLLEKAAQLEKEIKKGTRN